MCIHFYSVASKFSLNKLLFPNAQATKYFVFKKILFSWNKNNVLSMNILRQNVIHIFQFAFFDSDQI